MPVTDGRPDLLKTVQSHFAPYLPEKLGVAVSGGGDSMALLVTLIQWYEQGGPEPNVVTIDHRLRRESADEAAFVGRYCADNGLKHTVLHWESRDRRGNLQDQARRGRYALMAEWATGRGLKDLAVAHTLDDQAETFLQRLARGSGVDGLSCMSAVRQLGGLRLHRPFLTQHGKDLRTFLRSCHVEWCEDPTNADMTYQRVKARGLLKELKELGLDAEHLAETAMRLQSAREALNYTAKQCAEKTTHFEYGDVVIDTARFIKFPPEIRRRLLLAALLWISGQDYGPRSGALADFEGAVISGHTMTLHGCLGYRHQDKYRLTREYSAIAENIVPPEHMWDGRWQFDGNHKGLFCRALGDDGWQQIRDKKAALLPYRSVVASPSLWSGNELLAAPLAGLAGKWELKLLRDEKTFLSCA